MTELERIAIAKQRVKDLEAFYLHLLVFVLVNFGIFVVDAVQGGSWWFFWGTIGWSLGLLAHGAVVFFGGARVAAWEQRRLEQFIEEATDEDMEPIGAGARTTQHPLL